MRFSTLVLLGMCFVVSVSNAQDSIQHRTTINWTPPLGQNGFDATVEVSIRYGLFMGEPTKSATAKASTGNRVQYEGTEYTRNQVGDEIFDDFEFGMINVLADIYVGPTKLSTVRLENLISGDVTGSPNWDEVFPGVSEEAAKDAFKTPFTIRNVRLVDVKNRIYGIDAFVREQKREKDATQKAASVFQKQAQQVAKQEADEAAEKERQQEAARRQRQDSEAALKAERERQQKAAREKSRDAEAERLAERQRQQQEDFDRVQEQDRKSRRAADETSETVRDAIAQGMANSNATQPFFLEGAGVYITTAGWDGTGDVGVDAGPYYEFLSGGFVGPQFKGHVTFNLGMTFYKGHETSPVVPKDPATNERVDDFDFIGGEVGMGIKLGRPWGLLSNLAYPYVSVTAGQLDWRIDGERQTEFIYSFEYGARGTLYFLYYHVGYSEHYGSMVYGLGIVNPIRYSRHKLKG